MQFGQREYGALQNIQEGFPFVVSNSQLQELLIIGRNECYVKKSSTYNNRKKLGIFVAKHNLSYCCYILEKAKPVTMSRS